MGPMSVAGSMPGSGDQNLIKPSNTFIGSHDTRHLVLGTQTVGLIIGLIPGHKSRTGIRIIRRSRFRAGPSRRQPGAFIWPRVRPCVATRWRTELIYMVNEYGKKLCTCMCVYVRASVRVCVCAWGIDCVLINRHDKA